MSLSLRARTSLLRLAPIVAVLAVMLLVFATGWHHAVTLENVVALRDRFHHVLDKHPILSVIIYVLAYALAAALSLPGGLIFTMTGGLLFGWLVGGVAAVVAAGAGAILVFLIVRAAIADANLSRFATKLAWMPSIADHVERLRKLDVLLAHVRAGFQKDAMSYLLFLRFVPAFPFWAVNLMAAILDVPLKTYVIATIFGIIPATLAFASLGAGLDSVIAAAKNDYLACLAAHGQEACEMKIYMSALMTHELMLAFALLGFAALVPVAYKRWRRGHVAGE